MNRLLTLLLLVLLPLTLAIAQEEAPQRIWIRGTKVSLVPPAQFGIAADFPGVLHEESGSSVMITELPAPISKLLKSFTDEKKLEKRGLTLLTSEERKMGEHEGVFLTVAQVVDGISVKKAFWIFGTKRESVMAMGTIFPEMGGDWFPVVIESLKTCEWDLDRVVDPFANLGFELTDTQGLQFVLKVSNMLLFTEDGKTDKKNEGKLMFMMGPALGSGPIEDKEAFVERRMRQFPGEVLEIESMEPIEIDELPGFEVIASTVQKEIVRVRHVVILFEPDNYWVSFGEARDEVGDEALEKFQAIVRSFRRVEQEAEEPKPEPEPEKQ